LTPHAQRPLVLRAYPKDLAALAPRLAIESGTPVAIGSVERPLRPLVRDAALCANRLTALARLVMSYEAGHWTVWDIVRRNRVIVAQVGKWWLSNGSRGLNDFQTWKDSIQMTKTESIKKKKFSNRSDRSSSRRMATPTLIGGSRWAPGLPLLCLQPFQPARSRQLGIRGDKIPWPPQGGHRFPTTPA